jgi:hypothetical protein
MLDGIPGVEVKDVIKAVLGKDTVGFYLGNVLKYMLRFKKKNGLEDLKKARLYLDWAIEDYGEDIPVKIDVRDQLLVDVLKNTTIYSANGYIDRAVYTDPETHKTTSVDINDSKYDEYIVRQVYAEEARNEEKAGEDC